MVCHPFYIVSDQGANLTSNLMAAVCNCLGIAQMQTSAYHPQQVERFNRTLLESMLAKVKYWVSIKLIGIITFHKCYLLTELPSISMTQQDSLPFTLHWSLSCSSAWSYDWDSPQQRYEDVPSFVAKVHNSLHTAHATMRANITSAHQCNKEHYNKKRPFSPYSVGGLVWLHVSAAKPGRTKKFVSQ